MSDPIPTSRGLSRESWRYAGKRSLHGFVRHRGLDSAASLTFFATLALFPASLMLVSIFAIASGGEAAALARITDILGEVFQPSAVESIEGPLGQLLNIPNPGIALGIAIVLGIWTVSSYATAFGRAINAVYEVQEGRQFWKFRGLMIVVAIVLIVCTAVIAAILLGTPTVSAAIGENLGIPNGWIIAWDIAKWPVLVAIAIAIVGIIYYYTPNVRHLRLRWVSWGATLAILAWGAATAGFAAYVLTFETYNRVYGWLGGAVALLVWLYISNLVLVLGAELDAEIVRVRQLASGIPAETVIQLPLRDTARNLWIAKQLADDERTGRKIRERETRDS